jgi:hypothetical protein
MKQNTERLPVGLLLLLLFTPSIHAQKKGGSTAAAATPAATPAATASNAPFEVEMLAYGALDNIMERLAKYACNAQPAKVTEDKATLGPPVDGAPQFQSVVVLDPPAMQALQAYDAFTLNATAIASGYARMQGRAGAGSGIDDFSDITNAIAAAAISTTSESSFTLTIQDPTAAIVLLNHLKAQGKNACKTAYYAGVYSVDQAARTFHDNAVTSVSDQLNTLAGLRTDALKAIVNAGESTVSADRAKAGCAPVPSGTAVSSLYGFAAQDPCVTAFNSIDSSYNLFLQGLSGQNATTGQPTMSSAVQGYRLRAYFASATLGKPMLGLYLSISSAGGTQQDRKNLITALFTGDWIRYSGGVSVNIIAFQIANGAKAQDDNSKILLADLIRYRTPLGHIKKPAGYNGAAEAGDNLGKIPEVK